VFLDIAQAFDRVWHAGLLFKTRFLPAPLFLIIKSFLSNRSFAIRCADELSQIKHIKAGVPQGSILAPTLYNIFTSDTPHFDNTTLATFADDTCIISTNADLTIASNVLQTHLTKLQNWFNPWRIKINPNKSTHITFSLRPGLYQPMFLNNDNIPQTNATRYLGVHLDNKLTWAHHIRTKRKSLNIKLHKLRHILKSKLPLSTKLLIFKQIIRPTLTYGIQLWGTAKKSNIQIFQSFQSICLPLITNAPWYLC